jgi:hypothetical protein
MVSIDIFQTPRRSFEKKMLSLSPPSTPRKKRRIVKFSSKKLVASLQMPELLDENDAKCQQKVRKPSLMPRPMPKLDRSSILNLNLILMEEAKSTPPPNTSAAVLLTAVKNNKNNKRSASVPLPERSDQAPYMLEYARCA